MKKSTTVKPTYEVFNPDVYLSSGITKGEVLELKDAFDLLDSTGSGKIDPMGTRSFT
jgi:Ca2+-binding EF-hand superfamily protein